MITQAESGLSAELYNALLAETGDPAFELTLEQYSLAFTLHDSNALGAARDCFDAVVCGDVLVRGSAASGTPNVIRIDTLATEDGGDQVWSAQNLAATSISTTVPVSLVSSGNTVRVFWYDGTSVKYFESTDNGTTWGAAVTVGTLASVKFLAATSLTRVHVATLSSQNNMWLQVYNYTSSWVLTWSEIYWPFTFGSFDAVPGNQLDDGAASSNDILGFTTDYPPLYGVKVQGTELVHTVNRVHGIAFIRYQNARWSDHIEMDTIDKAPSYPSRTKLRMSTSSGILFSTYYRLDGSTNYSHSSIAMTRSKDGRSWESPYLYSAVITGPAILLKRGDHAYLLDAYQTYRSWSGGYTGEAKLTQDVSDNCTSLSLSMGDIQRLEATLANPKGELDATSPFADDVILQAVLKLGYVVRETATSTPSSCPIQVIRADVAAIGGRENVPADRVVLSARDSLDRVNVIRADRPCEWDSQAIGGDNFQSSDGTDWSGMRHTAVQDGSWKTPAATSVLELTSDKSPGVAFNTYCADAWNGSAQAGIKVDSTDSADYAGVLFHAYDKENFWALQYEADSDKLRLIQRSENTDIVRKQTYSQGWTYNTWYYLKVIYRYNIIWCYSSLDGIIWEQEFTYEVPGVLPTDPWTFGDLPILTGRMGYVGFGYSEDEPTIPTIPDPVPPPPVECPNTCHGLDLWAQAMDPVSGACEDDVLLEANSAACGGGSTDSAIIAVNSVKTSAWTNGGLFITFDLSNTDPTWHSLTNGLLDDEDIVWFARDPVHPSDWGYLVTASHIYRNLDLRNDGTWYEMLHISDLVAGEPSGPYPYTFQFLKPQVSRPGQIWAVYGWTVPTTQYHYLIYSYDYGASWTVAGRNVDCGSSRLTENISKCICLGTPSCPHSSELNVASTDVTNLVPSAHEANTCYVSGTTHAGASNATGVMWQWREVVGKGWTYGPKEPQNPGCPQHPGGFLENSNTATKSILHIPYGKNPHDLVMYVQDWNSSLLAHNLTRMEWQGPFPLTTEAGKGSAGNGQMPDWNWSCLISPVCTTITPPIGVPASHKLVGTFTFDKDYIWVVNNSALHLASLQTSFNGGASWNTQSDMVDTCGGSMWWVAACASGYPYNPGYFFVGATNYGGRHTFDLIKMSDDGGGTWQDKGGDIATVIDADNVARGKATGATFTVVCIAPEYD